MLRDGEPIFHRTQPTEPFLDPASVVIFNISTNHIRQFFKAVIGMPVVYFLLQQPKETFHHAVVKTGSLPGHALENLFAFQAVDIRLHLFLEATTKFPWQMKSSIYEKYESLKFRFEENDHRLGFPLLRPINLISARHVFWTYCVVYSRIMVIATISDSPVNFSLCALCIFALNTIAVIALASGVSTVFYFLFIVTHKLVKKFIGPPYGGRNISIVILQGYVFSLSLNIDNIKMGKYNTKFK